MQTNVDVWVRAMEIVMNRYQPTVAEVERWVCNGAPEHVSTDGEANELLNEVELEYQRLLGEG